MAEARSDVPPSRPSPTTTGNSYNAAPSANAVRQRLPHRQSSNGSLRSPPPELPRRRSSILSYSSLEDATNSFTDDLLNPSSTRKLKKQKREEDSNWHSTPLAFAILPALAGLFFNNGSAFVTDALLLGFAAMFMNWSIRIPRDWYYAAQATLREVEPSMPVFAEDLEAEDSLNDSLDESHKEKDEDPSNQPSQNNAAREHASIELRKQELFALFATFTFPAVAAYLLHIIRAQLSRPSTGLISDYNLCIFLLAAEFWPCRQVARLISARTLHLQRTVAELDDLDELPADKESLSSLTVRIAELEAKIVDQSMSAPKVPVAQKADVTDLAAEIRKRYEPRLEGLERAVRRYEKRSTTLAMVTEQRLQNLELRMQDTLSLAAAAAQHSQERNAPSKALAFLTSLVATPLRLAINACLWPVHLLADLYTKFMVFLFGSRPRRSAKRSASRHSTKSGTDDRTKERVSQKKVVR
ncbi:hypothetical protein Q7P37_005034 [Cladosporium fusiforme]